jgi:hypothetical protein
MWMLMNLSTFHVINVTADQATDRNLPIRLQQPANPPSIATFFFNMQFPFNHSVRDI